MVCFTIALRSKESTNHWDKVLCDFNNTLCSIFNQTSDEFRVYVGCNEIPKLDKPFDERLRFITANLPVPKTWEECCRDRSWKLLLCAQEIKKELHSISVSGGGTFVFPVDADDFVNCHIAEYVYNHPEANGFKSKKSYRWVKGQRYMTITPYYGGTMNIIKMFEDDLPSELPDQRLCFDKDTAMALTARYPIRWYDIEVAGKYAQLGKPFTQLPFRSTIYVVGTGENISAQDPANQRKSARKYHPVAFLRKISPFNKKLITQKIIKEFNLVL